MLALAYAGAHPEAAGPLVLIGCGTFDVTARGYMEATIEERTDDQLRLRLERLPEEISDPDERMREMGRLIQPIYSYELIRGAENDAEPESCDARGYEESWRDMIRLQEEGIYPRTFGEIKTPVLMLHGGFDPHPGQIIRASLEPHIAQLEYCEWERCGHSPWLEKHARDRFFEKLRQWLGERLRGAGERPSG
jgi:pimeloyl-ACP methyl ester carboxylesterase